MIAIIIPFYQKTPGLLLRAVESILAQEVTFPYRVIVVDDSSPIDAVEELAPVAGLMQDRLTIIRQPNGGPAAARNNGLDQLGPECDQVAFLDSDDAWEQGHLNRLHHALISGAEFFFSDYQRPNEPGTFFSKSRLVASDHSAVDGCERTYWYQRDFFDALLKGSPTGTSTVGYLFAPFRDIRFKTDLWACEDILFWMHIAKRASRVAFSDVCAVQYGIGVNIFEGAAWGTVARLKRTLGQAKYHLTVAELFALSHGQELWNTRFLRQLDTEFIESSLVCALGRKKGWFDFFKSYSRIRSRLMWKIPSTFTRLMVQKLRNTLGVS